MHQHVVNPMITHGFPMVFPWLLHDSRPSPNGPVKLPALGLGWPGWAAETSELSQIYALN